VDITVKKYRVAGWKPRKVQHEYEEIPATHRSICCSIGLLASSDGRPWLAN